MDNTIKFKIVRNPGYRYSLEPVGVGSTDLLTTARAEERHKFADQIKGIQETARAEGRKEAVEYIRSYCKKYNELKSDNGTPLVINEERLNQALTAINPK